MAEKLQAVRGTQDIFFNEALSFQHIEDLARKNMALYGYHEIRTPMFESSDVFHRTLGETSDMVSKETYTFLDRGGDSITLRPEGTAGVARAFISNGLQQHLPLKLFYCGPMFRYERPQKGRYRQFHQIGVECLGTETPQADVECLLLAKRWLEELGLHGTFELQLNTLGDKESRNLHREALVEYLSRYKNELSADSQIRLEKNPLRILDSKDANDQKIISTAPHLKNYLNSQSKSFFDQLLSDLNHLDVSFKLNDQLVRGIDYYTHTVFEFVTTQLGAQGAILSGGRYDGLIEEMGGPRTSGVGWAAGVERLSMLLQTKWSPPSPSPICVATFESNQIGYGLKVCEALRDLGYASEIITSGNMGKKIKKAEKLGAKTLVIAGETEILNQAVSIKNLLTGDQQEIPLIDLAKYFKK